MAVPKLMMILTENHTMLDPRDVRGLVDLALVAEDTGFDAVMVSEQVILGPDSAINGLMENPRMYAAIGNQDPMTRSSPRRRSTCSWWRRTGAWPGRSSTSPSRCYPSFWSSPWLTR